LSRVLRPTASAIDEAAAVLRRGSLVAFPTETVYGLGAVATNDRAVAAIYRAKGRPAHNPLIVHLADLAGVRALATLDARAETVAAAFWPGPLTLVLPRAPDSPISPLATAGLATVAVRLPAHPVARALLEATLLPVAAPSANPSGRVSPTAAEHVAADLGEVVELVLDGGPCPVGVESTVLDLSAPTPRLLRPGGLDRAALERLVGPLARGEDEAAPRSPGQLASHYAPRLPLRLDALEVAGNEALLAFGPEAPSGALAVRNLSPAGDLAEAARNLFAMLRELDAIGAKGIAVMPIPAEGLGEAIRDRLRRAAAPRARGG
jgi:L-threonylcarbamoyladenylate synthase